MKFCYERLIQIRKSLGINKAEAARRLNISAMGYGRYESGEREPSFQTVSYIADTFKTSIDYLYGETEDSSCNTITISADKNPEMYQLFEAINNNNELTKRLLAYISHLSE